MRAGRLHERVRFERRAAGKDSFGNPNGEWEPLATVWAAVEPLSGREYFAAQQVMSDTTVRIACPYQRTLADITPHDRAVHGCTVYDIRSVIDVNSRHKELQFMCTKHSIQ